VPDPDLGGSREVTRRIGVPGSVSPAAQAFLGMPGFVGGASPPMEDLAGWRELIEMSEAGLLALYEVQNAHLHPDVEAVVLNGVPVYRIIPEGITASPDQPVYFDIHGGALIMGGGKCCEAMAVAMAATVGMELWSVDYRMPPEHPYPAALDDCVASYRGLLEHHAPQRIVVGGLSAGGNLAAALMLRGRDEGLPRPAALVLNSPEVDLTESGDSFQTNLGIDSMLTQSLAPNNELYAGGHDLTDPYLSPLFGDFTDAFPPTLLQAGTRDLFLSNAVRMHRKLRAAGVEAELHIAEAMPHGGFFGAPEDLEMAEEVRRFMSKHLQNSDGRR
jgi:monoterpene epsilon-lactone hydrolase